MTDTANVPKEPTREMLQACLAAMRADKFRSPKRIWSAMLAAAPKAEPVSDPYKLGAGEVLQWVDGAPEKFRRGEWFIAMTAWNNRVCLKALPEEYSYDFTTADGTYIKEDKIVKWMPFPDSEYRYPAPPAPASDELLEDLEQLVADYDSEGVTGPLMNCLRDLIAKHKGPQS